MVVLVLLVLVVLLVLLALLLVLLVHLIHLTVFAALGSGGGIALGLLRHEVCCTRVLCRPVIYKNPECSSSHTVVALLDWHNGARRLD